MKNLNALHSVWKEIYESVVKYKCVELTFNGCKLFEIESG